MSLISQYENLFKEGDLYIREGEVSKAFKCYKKSITYIKV